MDIQKQLRTMQIMAAAITTMDEENEPIPESYLYTVAGMDMEQYETVKRAMLNTECVTLSGHQFRITDKGREAAKEFRDKFGITSRPEG